MRIMEIGQTKLDDVSKLLQMAPKGAPTAISNAMNRAIVTGRAQAVRQARSTYNISAGELKKRSKIKKSSPSNLRAVFSSEGSPISLMNFKVSKKSPTNRPTVIKASVKKGSNKSLPGYFVAIPPSGGAGVFKRSGKSSLPVEKAFGPSVPQMIGSESVLDMMEKGAQDMFDKRIEHEIDRLLSKG